MMKRGEAGKHEMICPKLHWQFVAKAETGARFSKTKKKNEFFMQEMSQLPSYMQMLFPPVIHTAAGSAQQMPAS